MHHCFLQFIPHAVHFLVLFHSVKHFGYQFIWKMLFEMKLFASYIIIISFLLWSYFILHCCLLFDAVLKFKWRECLELMHTHYLFNLWPEQSTTQFSVFNIFQDLPWHPSYLFHGENMHYVLCYKLSINDQVVLVLRQCVKRDNLVTTHNYG